jgi:hypothetical protein
MITELGIIYLSILATIGLVVKIFQLWREGKFSYSFKRIKRKV